MDLGLKGKIAVVTGSTAGIGFAIANTLAAEGAQVTVNGRTQVRVDSADRQNLPRDCAKAEVRGVAADLGTADGVKSFCEDCF